MCFFKFAWFLLFLDKLNTWQLSTLFIIISKSNRNKDLFDTVIVGLQNPVQTGFSVNTVSLALRNSPRIPDETRRQISEVPQINARNNPHSYDRIGIMIYRNPSSPEIAIGLYSSLPRFPVRIIDQNLFQTILQVQVGLSLAALR